MKEVNENDIKEVLTTPIDEHAFSMVLTCWPDKDEGREYKELSRSLRRSSWMVRVQTTAYVI